MKIAAISDAHGRQDWTIPPCDVFIHAGDTTAGGSLQETAQFAAKLRDGMLTPGGPQHAIIVPGNYDECFESLPEATRSLFDSKVHVLLGKAIVLDGICFYGSPWTPPFMAWHFMASEDKLAALYENMPKTVDVLITHGPLYGVLDPGSKTLHAGSSALAEAVSTTYGEASSIRTLARSRRTYGAAQRNRLLQCSRMQRRLRPREPATRNAA